MAEPNKISEIPADLPAFINNRYNMSMYEFNLYVSFNNNTGSATQESKNGIFREVVPNPKLLKASDVLSEYEMRAHNNTTAGPPTPQLRADATKALNDILDFCDKGLKHIYFGNMLYSSTYKWIVGQPSEENSKFSKLPVFDQAIINNAVANRYDAESEKRDQDELNGKIPHKLPLLDNEHINKRRQEIIDNEPLFLSLKQMQRDLRDKYRGTAAVAKEASQLPTPEVSISASPTPGRE